MSEENVKGQETRDPSNSEKRHVLQKSPTEEIQYLGQMLSATTVVDRKRIRNIARRLEGILYESCDHSCGTFQFEGDDVCRECKKFIS